MNWRTCSTALAMALAAATPAGAQTLKLAPVFSDHMVMQRDKPVPVEGHAASGAEVSAQLGDAPASLAGSICQLEKNCSSATRPP